MVQISATTGLKHQPQRIRVTDVLVHEVGKYVLTELQKEHQTFCISLKKENPGLYTCALYRSWIVVIAVTHLSGDGNWDLADESLGDSGSGKPKIYNGFTKYVATMLADKATCQKTFESV